MPYLYQLTGISLVILHNTTIMLSSLPCEWEKHLPVMVFEVPRIGQKISAESVANEGGAHPSRIPKIAAFYLVYLSRSGFYLVRSQSNNVGILFGGCILLDFWFFECTFHFWESTTSLLNPTDSNQRYPAILVIRLSDSSAGSGSLFWVIATLWSREDLSLVWWAGTTPFLFPANVDGEASDRSIESANSIELLQLPRMSS